MPQLVGPHSVLLTLSLTKGGSLPEDMVTLLVVPLLLFEECEVSLEVPESVLSGLTDLSDGSGVMVGLSAFCPVDLLSLVFLGTPLILLLDGL